MSAEVDAMIKEGIRLYKAGKKSEARAKWEQVTELDQLNEQAWLWLSAVVESVDDQRTCLENVLYINPANANARKGLDMLEAKNPAPKASPAPPAPIAPPPPAPAEPPKQQPSRAYDPPTATSSASSTFVPDETAPEVYDDWIGSLNLSGSSKGAATSPSTAPFTLSDDVDDDIFSDDDLDDFSFDDPPPAKAAQSQPRRGQTDNLRAAFMQDDDEDADSFSDPFGDSDDDPFAEDPFADFDEADEPNLKSGPFSAAALDFDDDDDDDEVVDAAALRGIQSGSSPAPSRASSSVTAGKAPIGKSPVGRSSAGTASKPPVQSFANTNASRYYSGESAKPMDEPDPSEYFAAIPAQIRATRLPGMDEKHPTLVVLLLVLLVLLNLGAAALLVFQLVT